MPHGFCVFQERCHTSLDRQRRYSNDELVDTTSSVQLKHRAGIYIRLTRTRFHLDVEYAMLRQRLNLFREVLLMNAFLCGFLQYVGLLAHSLQGVCIQAFGQQGVLMVFLRFLDDGCFHNRCNGIDRQQLVLE